MNKKLLILPLAAIMFLIFANFASAHAVVSPKQANIGQFTSFSLGVPSEKDVATTQVRLLIPDGLNYVTPNVKPGWKIDVKKEGEGENAKVSEIDWSAGSIPGGQRDEFVFSAQVPAQAATLHWKVYQTYADGSMVSWDQDPNAPQAKDDHGKTDFSQTGPYSQTQVVNDLSVNPANPPKSSRDNLAFIFSIIALALSLAALQGRKKSS